MFNCLYYLILYLDTFLTKVKLLDYVSSVISLTNVVFLNENGHK